MSKGTGILREQNKRKILFHLRQCRETTRKDLAETLQVSKNTISLIVDEFIHQGILKEVGIKEPGTKGRPKVIIQMNENAYQSIGFIINKNEIEYTVTNYYGKVLEQQLVSSPNKNSEKAKRKLQTLIKSLLGKYDKVLGVGIGIPGIVDRERQIIYRSTRLEWQDVSLIDEEHQAFSIPFTVENSVNLGALHAIEQEGSQQGGSSFYIRVEEGVGGAYIIDNKIINGGSWTVGEIGHISLDPKGEVCACGQKGCLEHLINTNTFRERLANFGQLMIEDGMFSNEAERQREVKELFSEFGTYLGKALVYVIHLINPNQIVIDTPYNRSQSFSTSCLNYIENNALQFPIQKTKIIFSKERSSLSTGAALSTIINYERLYW
ncbi:ROK family protein [Gracilibacillus sp. HCP3S3_G5_1]|uniref:ROK family protein n=1 Tax=unclassified Gracilibacillus TaxID=2625209 RepID=UPI003F8AA958